jgi:hypothetical protein
VPCLDLGDALHTSRQNRKVGLAEGDNRDQVSRHREPSSGVAGTCVAASDSGSHWPLFEDEADWFVRSGFGRHTRPTIEYRRCFLTTLRRHAQSLVHDDASQRPEPSCGLDIHVLSRTRVS